MYSRVLFLLGVIVFELTASGLPEQGEPVVLLLSSSPLSCLFQCQTAEEKYGLCTVGCKDSCQEVACCFPRYSPLPVQGEIQLEYPWDDHLSVLLATSLLCCRGKTLASCSPDSLTDADFGCMINSFGLDCSPAPGGACELYCPGQKKYSCPVNYAHSARSNDCCSPSDNIFCCFQQATEQKQMQEPIFVRARSSTPVNME